MLYKLKTNPSSDFILKFALQRAMKHLWEQTLFMNSRGYENHWCREIDLIADLLLQVNEQFKKEHCYRYEI